MEAQLAQPAQAQVQINSREDLLRFVIGNNLMLATNVYCGSIGHMCLEMDFLVRARRHGLIPDGRACLLTLPEEPFSQAFAAHYPDLLAPFCLSTRVWRWAQDIAAALPELAFNIGCSHFSVERPNYGSGHRPVEWHDRIEFLISHQACRDRGKRNYSLRSATSDWYPFRRRLTPSPALARFLESFGERPLALIHVKVQRINASAGPTDPGSYLPTLAHIRDLGWQPVLVGREPMPEEFRKYGVADYSGSGFASQADDLAIFSHGRVAITGASGIVHAAEIMDLPAVYTDSWHIDMLGGARRTVCVPTTLRERNSGRPLTIREQIAILRAQPDGAFWAFPQETHVAESPAAEHVLAALQEVLTLGPPGVEPPPPNALQQRFRQLDPNIIFSAGTARVGAAWAAAFESRYGDVM